MPAFDRLVAAVLAAWPEHARAIETLRTSLSERQQAIAEDAAARILAITGDDLAEAAESYRATCGWMLEEELFFRRNGRYRHHRLADVIAAVYSDATLMRRYMHGLLLSQALWPNHVALLAFYHDTFLAGAGGRHLEVGPGHGLLLFYAAQGAASVAGWDISEASVAATRACLDALGVSRPVELACRDIHDPPDHDSRFDTIVASELLEHVEDPRAILVSLRHLLAPGGRVFVNVPVNSPAIDHIYLFNTPEEVHELCTSAGFAVVDSIHAPANGLTLARARKMKATISCGLVLEAAS